MSEFGTPDEHRTVKRLVKLGTAATVVAGIAMGARIAAEAEKGPTAEPDSIKQGGIIEITPHPAGLKPLRFRDRSWIPQQGLEDNTIPQDQVNLPGGQTAASVDHFYISNYLLEEGYNPELGENKASKGVWLVFPEADGTMTRMSLSINTSDYWKVIAEGKTKPGHLDQDGNFVLNNGKSVEDTKVSQVSLDLPQEAQQANP